MTIHPGIASVTRRIAERSRETRHAYLQRLRAARGASRPGRMELGCSNFAHGVAACEAHQKQVLMAPDAPGIGIVTAYNDMLSAHQPFETYPQILRAAVASAGGFAQVAGGVPAMCDGITQGRAGMELSLFSRDVIAMATAVALSHDMFDGALLLGVCDKIVPGLVTGALCFGHLPMIFVPAGPMPSGISNAEKAKVRQEFASGRVGRDELLAAEMAAYHAPGTCTFYGTANSNQMLMEIMGLHLPGASFVAPGTALRCALTEEAGRRVTAMARGEETAPIGEIIDERVITNALIGLLATGGSTNHTLHLVAMARAAGLVLDWQDFSDLSAIIPLLAKVYPNGEADVNAFHEAGGMAFLIRELLENGMLYGDVMTVAGPGLERYTRAPTLRDGALVYVDLARDSADPAVLTTIGRPFAPDGGLKVLSGNLGRAVIKTSAVKPENRVVEAPCRVFNSQEAMLQAFQAGELNRDVVCVVRFQGPKANGMPELHKLTPLLGVLQDLGYKVALVTDGRMSGASGKVPAAIHVTPEALNTGMIGYVQDGDIIRLDAVAGVLELKVEPSLLHARSAPSAPVDQRFGTGRELFAPFRQLAGGAEEGAGIFRFDGHA
ncbi:phosphogluconate dehydratase [Haematospirillum sp. H1815]|nr:phosphogluconate dehydratase [Haematospirillum sp. H1815]NKD77269.1 phosphogluconate dehydratase [Haematospirillum sp. H1815]